MYFEGKRMVHTAPTYRKFRALFNSTARIAKSPRQYAARETVFEQGDPSRSLFYILKGKVQFTVAAPQRREAVVAILNSGTFFGEECLAGQRFRAASAKTLTPATIARVTKPAMLVALRKSPALSELLVQHLLSRNMRIQEDLVDHIFNTSEKRLARVLLLLAQFGKNGTSHEVWPRISQETLAKMVGTTRERVNFFMNRFRKLGFIEYNGKGMRVHSSLMGIVVHP